jgi:hypothetical protein
MREWRKIPHILKSAVQEGEWTVLYHWRRTHGNHWIVHGLELLPTRARK